MKNNSKSKLYADDHPELSTKGTGFKNEIIALNTIKIISSRFKERLGIAKAAMATIKPSTSYLMARLTNSPKSNIPPNIIYKLKRKNNCLK